jgi:hypothetical protein
MILRLLNPQGIAGVAAALCLALLLILQKGDTRHWRKHAERQEQLYRAEQGRFVETVANYREAAEAARAADRANAARVAAAQTKINERTANDYQTRVAAARTRADELRRKAASAPADPSGRRSAPVPALPAPARRAAESAVESRLPPPDALIATEQAIQLDELIKWVKAQAALSTNPDPPR